MMHLRESTAYRTSIGERDGPSIVLRKSVCGWVVGVCAGCVWTGYPTLVIQDFHR